MRSLLWRMLAILVLLIHTHTASAADQGGGPEAPVLQLFDALAKADTAGIRACYSPRARLPIDAGLSLHPAAETQTRLRNLMADITQTTILRTDVHGDAAEITVLLVHPRYREVVQIRTVRTGAGWRIDGGERPPFFIDDWVHLVPIWQQAYQRSKNAATPEEAYADVMLGLRYALGALSDRPDDLTLNFTVARLYDDRIAGAEQRGYFVRRLMGETLAFNATTQPNQQSSSHLRLVDDRGFILPGLLARDVPQSRPAVEREDGAELRYLRSYNSPEAGGFPYGVPPQALAYNYYKRAQALRHLTQQENLEAAPILIENRPAIALAMWARQERDFAREAEQQLVDSAAEAHGDPSPGAVFAAAARAQVPRGQTSALQKAVFSYLRAQRVCEHADVEYADLLARWLRATDPKLQAIYRPQVDELRAIRPLMAADAAFLNAASAAGERQQGLLLEAQRAYAESATLAYRLILKYYIEPDAVDAAFASDGPRTREDRIRHIESLDLGQCAQACARAEQYIRTAKGGVDLNQDDRADCMVIVHRAEQRRGFILDRLRTSGAQSPAQAR